MPEIFTPSPETNKEQENNQEIDKDNNEELKSEAKEISENDDEDESEYHSLELDSVEGPDLDNIKDVASWVEETLDNFAEENSSFGRDYMLEDAIQDIALFFANKLNTQTIDLKKKGLLGSKEKFEDDDLGGPGEVEGNIYLFKRDILEYVSYGDGYSFSISEFNGSNLEKSLADLIDLLKSEK